MRSSTIRRQIPCRDLLELAQSLSKQQRYAEAVAELNKALDISPELGSNVRFFLNRGSYNFKANRSALALQDFCRASELDDNLASVHFNKGNVLKTMGDRPEDALKSFQRACELDPRLADAHIQVSLMFLQLKRFQFALAAAQRALQLDPTNVSALLARLRSLVSLAQFDQAVDTIHVMIQCYQRQSSTTTASSSTLESAVPLPQRKMFARILMMAASASKSSSSPAVDGGARAISLAKQATELLPSYDTFSELGTQLMRHDRYSDAALMFRKASECDAQRVEALIQEGAALISAKQPERALVPLKRAGRLEEGRKEVRYYQALAYFNLARYLEAIPSLTRIVEDAGRLEEHGPDPVVEKARFVLSSCYIQTGEEQRAYQLLHNARLAARGRGRQVSTDVLFQAGYVSSLVGRDEEARECFEEVLRMDPKDSRGICGLANLKEKHAKVPSAPPIAGPPPSAPPSNKPASLVNKFLPRMAPANRPTAAAAAPAPPAALVATPSKSKLASFAPFRKTSKPVNQMPLADVVAAGGGSRWDCNACGCNNEADMTECFGCNRPYAAATAESFKPKLGLLAKSVLLASSSSSSSHQKTSSAPPARPVPPPVPAPLSPTAALKPSPPTFTLKPRSSFSGGRSTSTTTTPLKPTTPVVAPPPRKPPPPPVPSYATKPPPASSQQPVLPPRPTTASAASSPMGSPLPPPPPPLPTRPEPLVDAAAKTTTPPRLPKRVPPPPARPSTTSHSNLSPILESRAAAAAAVDLGSPPPPPPPSPPHAHLKAAMLVIAEPNKPPPLPTRATKVKLSREVMDMITSLFAEHEAEFVAMFEEEGLEQMLDVELLSLEDLERLPGMRRAWARRVVKYVQDRSNKTAPPPPPVPASRPASSALLMQDIGQFQRSGGGATGAAPRLRPVSAAAALPSSSSHNDALLTRIKSFERTSLRAADLRPPVSRQPVSAAANAASLAPPPSSALGFILDAMNSRRMFIDDDEEDKQQRKPSSTRESDEEEDDMFEAEW